MRRHRHPVTAPTWSTSSPSRSGAAPAPSTATACARSWASRATGSRPSSRSCSSTPASPTTTWTSTTRWSTTTTATSSCAAAGPSWTSSRGATRMVTGMCHTIEDGTFDVTAQAVNPKAQVRAVHRPPRAALRPGAALPVGGRHRRGHRDPPRGRHHHHDPHDRGGHVPLPRHARRHAACPTRARSRVELRANAVTEAAVTVPRRRGLAPAPHRAPGRGGRATGRGGRRRGACNRGYDGLTVRNVARRAGVAPATAYTYFASKDHLLAEVLWRRLQALPVPGRRRRRRRVGGRPGHRRAAGAGPVHGRRPHPRRGLHDGAARERARGAGRCACCSAPRCTSASPMPSGDDADEAVLRSLDLAYSGAMLWAGMGHIRLRGRARRAGRRGPTWCWPGTP